MEKDGSGSGKQFPTCQECGRAFESKKDKREYTKAAKDVILCRNRGACRSRKLAVDLEIDLFSRNPRERVIETMSIKPSNWPKNKKWIPVYLEHERVEAAIEYFSWCYPVCLPYAVQVDVESEPLKDRYGKWAPHTHATLAAFLGMSRQNVTRAIHRLERMKRLRIGDGLLYLVPKPHLNPEDRLGISTDAKMPNWLREEFEDFAVPSKWIPTLADLLADAPADISTDAMAAVKASCTEYNQAHQRIRTARDSAIKGACTAAATLLSRPVTFTQPIKRASSHSEPTRTRTPSKPNLDEQGRRAAAEYLYAEIPRMQAAFPHAPFSKPRFSALGKADRILAGHILDALQPTNYNTMGFVDFVAAQFKGVDQDGVAKLKPRSPNDPNGPRSLGLLIEWARDYAATFNGRANGAGH